MTNEVLIEFLHKFFSDKDLTSDIKHNYQRDYIQCQIFERMKTILGSTKQLEYILCISRDDVLDGVQVLAKQQAKEYIDYIQLLKEEELTKVVFDLDRMKERVENQKFYEFSSEEIDNVEQFKMWLENPTKEN